MKTRIVLMSICVAVAAMADTLINQAVPGKYLAAFANANGNPPWPDPNSGWEAANSNRLHMIYVQTARAVAIKHWMEQTEYPLTLVQRQTLTNSLNDVNGFLHDYLQFGGPQWCIVGVWPQ